MCLRCVFPPRRVRSCENWKRKIIMMQCRNNMHQSYNNNNSNGKMSTWKTHIAATASTSSATIPTPTTTTTTAMFRKCQHEYRQIVFPLDAIVASRWCWMWVVTTRDNSMPVPVDTQWEWQLSFSGSHANPFWCNFTCIWVIHAMMMMITMKLTLMTSIIVAYFIMKTFNVCSRGRAWRALWVRFKQLHFQPDWIWFCTFRV